MRREFNILGGHLSEKENIQVIFLKQRNEAFTDGKRTIYFPANLPQKLNHITLATLLHEAGHIREGTTRRFLYIRNKVSISSEAVIRELFNVVEDVRIDKLNFQRYPSAISYEQEVVDWIFGDIKEDLPILHTILSEAIVLAEGLNLPKELLPSEYIPIRDKITEELKKVPLKKRGVAKKMAEIIENIYSVIKEFVEENTSPVPPTPNPNPPIQEEQQEEENSPAGNQSTGEFSGEDEEGHPTGTQDDENQEEQEDSPFVSEGHQEEDEDASQEEEAEGEGKAEEGEDTEEESEQEGEQQQGENPSQEGEVENTEEESSGEDEEYQQEEQERENEEKIEQEIEKSLEDFVGISGVSRFNEIYKNLPEEEKQEEIREVKISPAIARRLLLQRIEKTQGNTQVNVKKSSWIYTNPRKLFTKSSRKETRTTIYLVVDTSGSMDIPFGLEEENKTKGEICNEALYSICSALQTLPQDKIQVKVLLFADKVSEYPLQKIIQKRFPKYNGMATIPTLPLEKIESEIKNQRGKVRVIFITDGLFTPADTEFVIGWVRRNWKVEFVGVLLPDTEEGKTIKPLIGIFTPITDPQELEKVFAKAL